MKLSKIKPNPNNPRTIRDWKFDKLKKSILEFPKMLDLRPIVIDSDFVILGGNMRFRVLQDLAKSGELEGLTGLDKNEIPDSWVRKAEELTEDESRRFILADNGDFGEWDFDALANEWDEIEIKDWAGIELPETENKDLPEKANDPDLQLMELELYEHYDYIVIVSDNVEDWNYLVEKLNIEKKKAINTKRKQKVSTGVCRAIFANDLIKIIQNR